MEINCSCLRGELLSSELFGHARGAFTSAVGAREGLLEFADGGTLLLDEIGDMEPGVQSQFLKVLEEKRFRRLGENVERQSDFRLIAATNHDLEEDVRRGLFRADLYYRIHVLPIPVPPLRDRREDLPGLASVLLNDMGRPSSRSSPAVHALLSAYHWPSWSEQFTLPVTRLSHILCTLRWFSSPRRARVAASER